jgi:hypothetical protein
MALSGTLHISRRGAMRTLTTAVLLEFANVTERHADGITDLDDSLNNHRKYPYFPQQSNYETFCTR